MSGDALPAGWPANGLRPHPIAAIFRLMDAGERADLAARIRASGLRQPIVMYEGMILDGRNRYLAAVEAGLFAADVDYRTDPHFEFFGGMGWDRAQNDPLAYVWDTNEGRRHDSPSQRAMNAARYANMRQGHRSDLDAAEAEPSANLREVSQAEAAEKAGVSERLVSSASAVLDHGTPELQQAVDEGRIAVSAAEQLARMDEAEQRLFASLDRAEAQAELRKKRRKEKKPVELTQALPAGKFAAFAQSVLNVARGQASVAAETIIALAEQHGIVRREGEGFVLSGEALAAMGTLAAAEPKRVEPAPVRRPLTAYQEQVAAATDLKGRHIMETAEPILRAGVEAGVKRQQIADDIGHSKGTVQGWLFRLGLTDKARLHDTGRAVAEHVNGKRARAGSAAE